MTEVTWFGAVVYCMWLNEKEFGSDISKWKYHLPTEWEFELMIG
ncbi:SUMF1/EgtB/PvdO family nonheme iron enzyme [bacterium]|nr:SUMF1/EgtB/PvdO family nonheme iron enzyme [bacterium]